MIRAIISIVTLMGFIAINVMSMPLMRVEKSFIPTWNEEGDRAEVLRIIGTRTQRLIDPFLMLDYFKVRLPAGFPDHPHRGFETVTYMISGTFHHQDFKGHQGTLEKGDVQWMTAGKGIIHSENPGSYYEDSIGFQLWINLKQTQKMMEPTYQEIKSKDIPIWKEHGIRVKIIAGKFQELSGLIETRVRTTFLDVHLREKGKIFETLSGFHENCLAFVYRGSIEINSETYDKNTAIIFATPPTGVMEFISIKSYTKGAKFVLLCGEPTKELVYNEGPFVMDSKEGLAQAWEDYRFAKNGFEGSNTWRSKKPDPPPYEYTTNEDL